MCVYYIYTFIYVLYIYIWGRQNHTASWARSCGARCVGVRVCVVCEARMLLLAGPALWCQRGEGPPVGMVKRAENGIDYTSTKNQVSDPSIHPSIHQAHKQENMYVHQALYHASNHGKPTNKPTRQKVTFFSLSMMHPSLYVFSPNPSSQQAKQGEPTNTSTKGSGVKKKG